jgi:hypothetical protein
VAGHGSTTSGGNSGRDTGESVADENEGALIERPSEPLPNTMTVGAMRVIVLRR